MQLKVYINEKYYRTIETGTASPTYDPSIVMTYINADKKQGLLNSFEIDTKGLGIKVEPV